MVQRANLQNQLVEAWHECIANDYSRQRINSERSLQASLWSTLKEKLDQDTRRMFIEPCVVRRDIPMDTPKQESRYPDIVICNTRSVIGVVELKYQPRVAPQWNKDIRTLLWFSQFRAEFAVQNTRFRGVEKDNRAYPFSPSVLFVWAGIHASTKKSLADILQPEVEGSFLELHAETRLGKKPRVWHLCHNGKRDL